MKIAIFYTQAFMIYGTRHMAIFRPPDIIKSSKSSFISCLKTYEGQTTFYDRHFISIVKDNQTVARDKLFGHNIDQFIR